MRETQNGMSVAIMGEDSSVDRRKGFGVWSTGLSFYPVFVQFLQNASTVCVYLP